MKTINELKDLFTNPRTEEFDTLIEKFVQDYGNSPFTNIDMQDDGTMNLDMESKFNDKAKEIFGDDLNEIITDYFTAMMQTMLEELEEGNLEFTETPEN